MGEWSCQVAAAADQLYLHDLRLEMVNYLSQGNHTTLAHLIEGNDVSAYLRRKSQPLATT